MAASNGSRLQGYRWGRTEEVIGRIQSNCIPEERVTSRVLGRMTPGGAGLLGEQRDSWFPSSGHSQQERPVQSFSVLESLCSTPSPGRAVLRPPGGGVLPESRSGGRTARSPCPLGPRAMGEGQLPQQEVWVCLPRERAWVLGRPRPQWSALQPGPCACPPTGDLAQKHSPTSGGCFWCVHVTSCETPLPMLGVAGRSCSTGSR